MKTLSAYQHIHCIGIGGIGLSAIAEILLARGHRVSGSDMKDSEIAQKLRDAGAAVYIGHEASQVGDADLVIYSAAISPENPERKYAEEQGIETVSRAQALGVLMAECKESIAVSGTHGKTTTTSMISLLLEHAQLDPTILVGGNLAEIDGNVKVGGHDYFITEACEYMDSFLSLRPRTEIILNIDSDHLDYFKDIDHIVRSFDTFAHLVPEDGLVIAYAANPFVSRIVENLSCRVLTFGFNDKCDYYADNIQFNSLGMPAFDLCFRGQVLCHLQLSVPGEHNIANALAAAACARTLGVSVDVITSTLEGYTGTQRRFDVIGVTGSDVRVVDDYGHHPTEIKATLAAAANIPHKNLWCIFQPHTYTRTLALFKDFAQAFDGADKLILADIYAAREKNIYKITSKELAAEIKSTHPGKEVYYFADFDEIANFVLNNSEPGDLVITMGAGDIYKVAELILEKDRRR
ncbi:MAG: UDP-N-acetylmuramate--L-alanine ligase [Clostridiales bacterium]|nr:UDP-N-acetylmuramate--L-alanine ligase [Clostridiales bacterium]